MPENDFKKIFLHPVKLLMQKIVASIESEDSKWFDWIAGHTAFILLISSFMGAFLTFVLNFYLYVYFLSYAIYWHINLSYIEINQGNIIYVLLTFVILSAISIYPFYHWSETIYINYKCALGTLAFLIAPFILLLISIWIDKFHNFNQLTIYYLSTILAFWFFISIFISVFLFISFMFFSMTKEYEIKRQEKKKRHEIKIEEFNKQIRTSILSKMLSKIAGNLTTFSQSLKKHFLNPLFFVSSLVFYIFFASLLIASFNRNFDIFQESPVDTYTVLSYKANYIYLAKCEINEETNTITVYSNIHKTISSDNLILNNRTFSYVDKK